MARHKAIGNKPGEDLPGSSLRLKPGWVGTLGLQPQRKIAHPTGVMSAQEMIAAVRSLLGPIGSAPGRLLFEWGGRDKWLQSRLGSDTPCVSTLFEMN